MPQWTQADYHAYLARRTNYARGAGAVRGAAPTASEAALHAAILAECRRRGWIALHGSMAAPTHRTLGEPDFVVLADRGRLLLIECKASAGKLTPEQAGMAAWAAKLGHTIHVARSLSDFIAMCDEVLAINANHHIDTH